MQYDWKRLFADKCFEEGFYRNAEIMYTEVIEIHQKYKGEIQDLSELLEKKSFCLAQQKKFGISFI